MDEKSLLILFGAGFAILVFLIIIFLVVLLRRNAREDYSEQIVAEYKEPEKVNTASLKDLVELVANRETSSKDVTNAVLYFIKNFPFPKREGKEIDTDTMVYLNFILLVASHKNADAKLIAHMSTELKNVNPTYKIEIENYEKMGLEHRKKSKI